jgi:hypothetical protein
MNPPHRRVCRSLLGPALVCTVSLHALAADTWVAVGYGGRRMISHDGVKWEITAEWAENGGDDSNNLMGAAYGKGKFVVVGGGGFSKDKQGGHILVSKDGLDWKEVHKESFRVNPVVFGGERFLAGGPDRTLLWSDDGETWEKGAQISADGFPGWAMWFRNGAHGNGTFVFMGEGGAKKEFHWCIASPDGKTASFRKDLPQLRSLAFGAGVFAAVGNEVIVTSPDGKEWTRQERAGDKLDWLLWTGKEFLCGGGATTLASRDGRHWTPHELKPQGRPVWTDGTRFISTQWPGKMSFSPDGRQWLHANPLTPNGINRVVKAESQP